jgi:hypothetical protein
MGGVAFFFWRRVWVDGFCGRSDDEVEDWSWNSGPGIELNGKISFPGEN